MQSATDKKCSMGKNHNSVTLEGSEYEAYLYSIKGNVLNCTAPFPIYYLFIYLTMVGQQNCIVVP